MNRNENRAEIGTKIIVIFLKEKPGNFANNGPHRFHCHFSFVGFL